MSLIAMKSAMAMITKSKTVCRNTPYFSTTGEPSGALYLQKSDGTLSREPNDFVQRRRSRLTYHFSFGQAF